MSSYNPGTIFRSYPTVESENTTVESKHYTAVLLKNGNVLEVKNPDSRDKTTFDSLEAWLAARPNGALKIDASKSFGIVIGSDTDGFNYPTDRDCAYYWVRWCYSIVKEAAPQLLKSEEFKIAYNNMVLVCAKYKYILKDYEFKYNGKFGRYGPSNIKVNKEDYLSGFSGYIRKYYVRDNTYHYINDNTEISAEIAAAYLAVVNIIKPEIKCYMNKNYEIATLEKKISEAQRKINCYKKRISNTQDKIVQLTDMISLYNDSIKNSVDTQEENLITEKMSAL